VNITPANNSAPLNVTTVVVATQANVNLASALANGQTVDGVTLATGQLVLVKAQTDPTQNGVYIAPSSGAASRAHAFGAYGLTAGRNRVSVAGGTNAGKTYLQTTPGPITVGSTSIVFGLYQGQLENQANVLAAQIGSMQRQSVNPTFSKPHYRVTEGISTPDNQALEGFFPKSNVKVATTAPIALTGLQTIDGVAVAAGDRVLVKDGTSAPVEYTAVVAATTAPIADLSNASVIIDGVTTIATNRVLVQNQADPKENGLYVVGTVTLGVAALTRATDMDTVGEVVIGKGVPVAAGGTANGGKTFVVSTVPATLGTDPLLFTLSSGTLVADEANGLYVVASGAWARAVDASYPSTTLPTDTVNYSKRVAFGMTVFVTNGTVNGKNSFFVASANPISLGVTPVLFQNLSAVITENKANVPLDNTHKQEAANYRSL
jgi:hypothetical protein